MKTEITPQCLKFAKSVLPSDLLNRLLIQSSRGWNSGGVIVFDRVANTGKKSDNVWSMFSSKSEAEHYYGDMTGKVIYSLQLK